VYCRLAYLSHSTERSAYLLRWFLPRRLSARCCTVASRWHTRVVSYVAWSQNFHRVLNRAGYPRAGGDAAGPPVPGGAALTHPRRRLVPEAADHLQRHLRPRPTDAPVPDDPSPVRYLPGRATRPPRPGRPSSRAPLLRRPTRIQSCSRRRALFPCGACIMSRER